MVAYGASPNRRTLLRDYAARAGQAISRRRSERALIAARLEAEAASQSKSAFLANMSHELRTPLNAIIGFSEILGEESPLRGDAAKTCEYARDINDAGRHLLGIINDILDVAKIESGATIVSLAASDIAGVVMAAHALMRERALAKAQLLVLEIEDDLPPMLLDPRRTRQVVINLLTNAVKFTPASGTITLGAARNEDGGVTISVCDNGPGMSAAELRHVLQPFAQVASAYTRGEEGTGLGLTIVSLLAKAQGARFEIASARGVGTRAEIMFPGTSVLPHETTTEGQP